MSEHHEPTLDLDRAFAALTRDVGDLSDGARRPGAGRAIRSARRRRAGAGALAATAAVVVVSAVLVLLPGGGDRGDDVAVDPGTPSSTTTLAPVAPAELTSRALSTATAGWVAGWRNGDSPVLTDAPCLAEDVPRPLDDSSEEYRARGVGASRVYATFADAGTAGRAGAAVRAGFAGCRDGEMPLLTSAAVGDAEVAAYGFPAGSEPRGVIWVVVEGDRVGLLTVVGAEEPPRSAVVRVGRSLVAGLAWEG